MTLRPAWISRCRTKKLCWCRLAYECQLLDLVYLGHCQGCDIPAGRKVAHARLFSSIRPHKTETHRVCVTVVGDKLDLPGIATTTCASLTTTKCLINSTVSTPLSKFMTLDIINFYYNTPMEWYQYMKMSLDMIPEEIIAQYQLCSLVLDGWIFIKSEKACPG